MKSKLNMFLLAGAFAITTPALALAMGPCRGDGFAHGGGRGHGGPRSFTAMLTRHATDLGIDANTLAAIKQAEDAARPELETLHTAVRKARDEARNGGDRSKVEAAHQALRTRREALRTQVTGLLTEAQRTKLRDLMQKKRAEMGKRHQRPDGGV